MNLNLIDNRIGISHLQIKCSDVRDVFGQTDHIWRQVRPRQCHHGRIHPARADQVHPDVLFVHFIRKGLGKARQRMLARSVCALERIALVCHYRGNVDNRRAGGLSQFRKCRLAKEIRSLRVQVHDPVIVFFRDFLKVLVLRDAGAINHDVQAAETLHRILNQALPESTVRDITGTGHHFSAQSARLRR